MSFGGHGSKGEMSVLLGHHAHLLPPKKESGGSSPPSSMDYDKAGGRVHSDYIMDL